MKAQLQSQIYPDTLLGIEDTEYNQVYVCVKGYGGFSAGTVFIRAYNVNSDSGAVFLVDLQNTSNTWTVQPEYFTYWKETRVRRLRPGEKFVFTGE